jgi:hypothetical protein
MQTLRVRRDSAKVATMFTQMLEQRAVCILNLAF